MTDPLFDLEGRIAVVTGGMGQLGQVYAAGLAERGMRVAVLDVATGDVPEGVRSFDVATFVAFGAVHLGIAGADVLMEFDYPEIYAPIDLGIGK